MSKEKHRLIDEKEQETTLFYYEIIGSFAIVFAITVLGKLGKIGSIFTMFFKVAFGDWYWLVVLFILFFGFYCLFVHQKFDFKNHRFVGFIFILFAILTYAHFPVHNYISTSSESYFSSTWQIYKSFINTGTDNTLGGGMIGAVIFYAVYYLLGSIGVIILGIILIILGLSLIFNRSLKEIGEFIFHRLKNIKKHFGSFNRFFRYEVGKEISETRKEKFKYKKYKLPLKVLSSINYTNIYSTQEVIIEEYNKKIIEYLYNKVINYKLHQKIISYYVYTLMYVIYTKVDYISLFKELKSIIKEEVLFSVDDNIIIIQITALDKRIFSLKEAIQINNDFINNHYVFGIDYKNNLVTENVDIFSNILLLGGHFVGIKNFINMFLIQSLCKNNIQKYQFYLYDGISNYKDFAYLFNYIDDDIFSFLEYIKSIIDERLECLRKLNVNSYQEYLKKIESGEIQESLSKIFVFITEVNNLNDKYDLFESKLLYFVQLSKKLGITIIYIVRKNEYLNNIVYSIFDLKLVFKCPYKLVNNKINTDKERSTSVLNNSLYLDGFGEAFFIQNNDYIRILTPKISKEDINNINEYLKK